MSDAPSVGARATVSRRALALVPWFVLHVASTLAILAWALRRLPASLALDPRAANGALGLALFALALVVVVTFPIAAARAGGAAVASNLPRDARRSYFLFALGLVIASTAILVGEGDYLRRFFEGEATIDKGAAKLLFIFGLLSLFALGASIRFLYRVRSIGALVAIGPGTPAEAVLWLLSPLVSSRIRLARCPDLVPGERSVLAFGDLHLTSERLLVLGDDGHPLVATPRHQVSKLRGTITKHGVGFAPWRLDVKWFAGGAREIATTVYLTNRLEDGVGLLAHVLGWPLHPELARDREAVATAAASHLEPGEKIVVAIPSPRGWVKLATRVDAGTVLTDRRVFGFEGSRLRASLERGHEVLVSEARLGPAGGHRNVWRRLAISSRGGGTLAFIARTIDAHDLLAALVERLSLEEVAVVPSPLAGRGEPELDWKVAAHAGI